MTRVKIITDSTCDLTLEQAKKLDIEIVPLNVHFASESFQDGIDLNKKAFYSKLVEGAVHPKTSQPSPEQFIKAYNMALKDNDQIISIHISSDLSGTYQSANIAAKEVGQDKIKIIDSRNVSSYLTLQILEIKERLEAGVGIDEIEKEILEIQPRIKAYFLVDTLTYLEKGGRIGKAQALVGGMLKIKPILQIKDGIVQPYEKLRGTKKALSRIVTDFESFVKNNKNKRLKVGISHSLNEESLHVVLERIKPIYSLDKIEILELGPVVGTHGGPGLFSLGYYASQ